MYEWIHLHAHVCMLSVCHVTGLLQSPRWSGNASLTVRAKYDYAPQNSDELAFRYVTQVVKPWYSVRQQGKLGIVDAVDICVHICSKKALSQAIVPFSSFLAKSKTESCIARAPANLTSRGAHMFSWSPQGRRCD
jgi:hypothetical protein